MFDNLKKKFNDNNDKIVNEDNNVNENENVNEKEQNYQIEKINNNFKKIDETKSFKDQIDALKEIPDLNDYWYIEYYEDNKDINLRLFKLKFARIFNDVDDIEINREKFFKQDEYSKSVIKQAHKRGDLLDTVRVILKFSEILSLDLT